MSVEFGVSYLEAAKASIAAQAGISLGEEKTASRNVTLQVDARSWVIYQIVWSEILTEGDLTLPDGKFAPYRARKGLRAELTSGKPQTCPTAAVPQSATAVPPIPTTMPPTNAPNSATAVPVVITSPPIVVTTTPVPTVTPVATLETSTNTIIVVTSVIAMPTITPFLVITDVVPVPAYPCEGKIKFTTGGKLNVVKLLPQRASQNQAPVEQGVIVSIERKQYNDQSTWYQIKYDNTRSIGWILSEFVIPLSNCPN